MSTKYPGRNKAYACPECGEPMIPHNGPWDMLHCFKCVSSIDLWWDKLPEVIESEPTLHVLLGFEGPTDSCLILSSPQDMLTKEFLIESDSWAILKKALGGETLGRQVQKREKNIHWLETEPAGLRLERPYTPEDPEYTQLSELLFDKDTGEDER